MTSCATCFASSGYIAFSRKKRPLWPLRRAESCDSSQVEQECRRTQITRVTPTGRATSLDSAADTTSGVGSPDQASYY